MPVFYRRSPDAARQVSERKFRSASFGAQVSERCLLGSSSRDHRFLTLLTFCSSCGRQHAPPDGLYTTFRYTVHATHPPKELNMPHAKQPSSTDSTTENSATENSATENSATATDAMLRRLGEAVALSLWRLGAVRVQPEEPFQLASGNFSPIYVNCRRAISDPVTMELFVAASRLLFEHRTVHLDAVAGGETAGIPFAAYLASALGKPMVYVRKKPKGYGLASQVEGHLAPGSRVLLVEDLITDGGSKVGFLNALHAAGGKVEHALVLFDRQQGGKELLAGHGVTLHAVVDRHTALTVGEAEGQVTAEAGTSVQDYFEDPAGWQRARGLDGTS